MSTSTPAGGPGVPDGGADERAQRKVMRGTVTSNKMQKTVVVQVDRKVRHPLYEKFISKRTKLYAHDENNEAKVGDVVEVAQTRPISKLKSWRVVRVVQKAPHA
jgi:small subunit ribosomal protein S17